MLKTPRAPVSGFTPQVRRATPGTAQQTAKDTASNGLKDSRGHRTITFQSSQLRLETQSCRRAHHYVRRGTGVAVLFLICQLGPKK